LILWTSNSPLTVIKIVQQPIQNIIIPEPHSSGIETVANTEAIQWPSDGLIFVDDQEDNVQTRGQGITNEDDPCIQTVANRAIANIEWNIVYGKRAGPV
jgi:hypothetical protein